MARCNGSPAPPHATAPPPAPTTKLSILTTTTTANRHATTRRFGTLLGLSLALCLLAGPGNADATQAKRSKANTGESAKKKGVSKVTYQRSTSEESPAERDRRMYRECKGLHNAGACRGYTRP